MASTSPVLIRRVKNRIEVESKSTGDVLASCYIGDEAGCEKIADILSAKYLGLAAMEFREMVQADRRAAMRPAKPGLIERIFGT